MDIDDVSHTLLYWNLSLKYNSSHYNKQLIDLYSHFECVEIDLYSRIYKLYFIDDNLAVISYNESLGTVMSEEIYFKDIIKAYNLKMIE